MADRGIDDLIGLDSAKRVMRHLMAPENNVHAVLLYGASGSGKEELAKRLIQSWLCLTPDEGGADGTCRACGSFERGNSPDYLLVAPIGPSRIIGVRQITPSKTSQPDDSTPIKVFFRTLPLMSKRKVVLIQDADRMNAAAFNALLKTLEEPFPHARLVLTSDLISSIPATILSRCLAIACESPTVEDLRSAFPDATEDEIRLAEGTPGRLKEIMARREVYARIPSFGRELLMRKPGEALVASEKLREVCDALEKATKLGSRASQAETLRLLAVWMAREPSVPPGWTQRVVEAHRRIQGNGSASIVFDALMTRLLRRRNV